MCVTALPSNSRATSVKQTATAAQDQLVFLIAHTLPQPGMHIIVFARHSWGTGECTGATYLDVKSIARCRYPGLHDHPSPYTKPSLAVFQTHGIKTSEAAAKRGNAQKKQNAQIAQTPQVCQSTDPFPQYAQIPLASHARRPFMYTLHSLPTFEGITAGCSIDTLCCR